VGLNRHCGVKLAIRIHDSVLLNEQRHLDRKVVLKILANFNAGVATVKANANVFQKNVVNLGPDLANLV